MLAASLIRGNYRPDQVTRTGVISPWNISTRNPVGMVYQVIDAFSSAVRNNGPGIFPNKQVPASTMMQTNSGNNPISTSAQVTTTSPAIPQPFYRNPPAVQAATPGSAGSYVTRDPDGAAVVIATGATGLDPTSQTTQNVINATVMKTPLSNIYPAMMAQRQALARGSAWQVSRAGQDMAREYRPVTSLPFKVGI
jgi:hypothetical protein